MSRIIVEQHGQRELREMPALFTVGRRPDCAVVCDSPEIAPVQARIDQVNGDLVLRNVGKSGLVFVNGAAVDGKRTITSRDEIQIGDVRLILPSEVTSVTSERSPGIRVKCRCGAGLQIASRYAGQRKHCPKCKAEFTVPSVNGEAKVAVARRSDKTESLLPSIQPIQEPAPTADSICSVCHCSILADEERTVCSACGLPHHADCWKENFGCSAYGCSQVNALKTGPDIRVAPNGLGDFQQPVVTPLLPVSVPTIASPPWEFGILALSVLSFLFGVVSYGLPCFFVGALIVGFVFLREGRVNWGVLVGAGMICLVGFVSGIVISLNVYAQ